MPATLRGCLPSAGEGAALGLLAGAARGAGMPLAERLEQALTGRRSECLRSGPVHVRGCRERIARDLHGPAQGELAEWEQRRGRQDRHERPVRMPGAPEGVAEVVE